jgi:DNA-binding MarR family transcriptional regulator
LPETTGRSSRRLTRGNAPRRHGDEARRRAFALTTRIDSPFDLFSHLPFRIAAVANLLAIDRDDAIRRASRLGLRELRVLVNIGSYMPIRASEIAYQTRMDSFTVSRAVKTLLARRLARLEADPTDRRARLLSLSPAGLLEYRRVTTVLAERDSEIAKMFSGRERRSLARTLTVIEELIEGRLAAQAEQSLREGHPITADQQELVRWHRRARGAHPPSPGSSEK